MKSIKTSQQKLLATMAFIANISIESTNCFGGCNAYVNKLEDEV
jgi:hypothetical protein